MADSRIPAAMLAAQPSNFPRLAQELDAARYLSPRPQERYGIIVDQLMAARSPDLAALLLKLEVIDPRKPAHMAAIAQDVRRLAERQAEERKRASGGPKLSYNVREIEAVTGLSRRRIFEEMKTGALKRHKRGSTTIVLVKDLEAFLDALPLG
jgi:hypothetical protein